MGWDQEVEVAQDLLPQSVSQSDIFEPNQVQLRSTLGPAGNPNPRLVISRFSSGYGFRFVNGRLVAFPGGFGGESAPCTSFAPIVRLPTLSIWPRLGRLAATCAARAARRYGWGGRGGAGAPAPRRRGAGA